MILGIMHDDGDGVARDVVGAYMWHNLAVPTVTQKPAGCAIPWPGI